MRLLQAPDQTVLASFINRIRNEHTETLKSKSSFYNFNFAKGKPFLECDSSLSHDQPRNLRFIWEPVDDSNSTLIEIVKTDLKTGESEKVERQDSEAEAEGDGLTTPPSEEDNGKPKAKKRSCSITQEKPMDETLKRRKID